MSAAASAPTHLRENPFEIAQAQLRRVGETFDVDPNLIRVLSYCKKGVEVSVPVQMDDGSVYAFQGYRVVHNMTRGPAKGGIRLPPGRHAGRGEGARDVDDVEVRSDGTSVRGRQGRRDLRSEAALARARRSD